MMNRICVFALAVLLVGSAIAAELPAAEVKYTLPRDARVSINILDANGWIVRELVLGEEQEAGEQTVQWDGRDAMGRPLPPGEYTWKLIHHTGVKAEYVLSVANSGQPPYRTEDNKGSWGACHGAPVSVTADATGLYLTWPVEEGNAVFTKTDYDGNAIFKTHASQAWGANFDSAVVGDLLYRVEGGGRGRFILKYNSQSGRYVNWDFNAEYISGGRLQLDAEPAPKDEPVDENNKPDMHPQAVAANADFVAVSFPGIGKVAIYRATGEKLKELGIEQPRGLTFLSDGRLAVVTPNKVLALSPVADAIDTLITDNLSGAWGITTSLDGKTLWITDQGESHQVKQFELDGTLLKAFGREGGMPREGKIDHQSFYEPRGIACGADGNIYVTETSWLRRISRVSPEGEVLREWFGPLGPQKTCWPNLSNFDEVYYTAPGNAGMIQCEIDRVNRTWYPVAWYAIDAVPQCSQPFVWERDGRKFLYAEAGKIHVYNPDTDRYQTAFTCWVDNNERMAKLWTDINLNGQIDEGELQVLPVDELRKRGLSNLGLGQGRVNPETFEIHAVMGGELGYMKPDRFENGLPVYGFDNIRRLTQAPARGPQPDSWYDPFPIYYLHGCEPASDGGVFTAINGGYQAGKSFWDRASWNYLMKFDSEGKLQWRAGVHSKTRGVKRGEMRMLFRICGISNGLIYLSDVEVQVNVYTEDGIYVDSLMDSNDMTGGRTPLSPNSLTVEHFTGLVADDPVTGKTYFYAGSTEDARMWEITGADTIQRMSGTVTLRTAQPMQASERYAITRTPPPRKPEYNDGGADGFLTEPGWEGIEPLHVIEDGKLLADIFLRYDDAHLWIAAHVWDDSPAANAALDPETVFTRGDCVDIYLGADPAKRSEPAPGDVRIVLAPIKDGKMYNGAAVIYRAKVAEGAEKKPYEFGSPVSQITMDYVAEITGERLVSFWRWRSGHGYTCEARIPLSELPEFNFNSLEEPKQILFDAGIIYSNIGGNNRIRRAYWKQNDADSHCTVDLPTEAKLSPAQWGTATIQPAKQ